ncbi:MAG: AraC family transcriptional regulator [Proteobacteria bacterium]|nr:AraC family transcriptional regulator [Pseudomonadota bacterium]
MHERIERLLPHAETSHTEHGLTYLVDGWFRMEHGTEIKAEPGSITVVPAGAPHRPIEGRNVEYWLVAFCASCVQLDEGQLLMSPFRKVRRGALPVVVIPRSRRRRVRQLLRELRDECERNAPESRELVRSLLLLLLGEIRRAMTATQIAGPDGALVSQALEFVQQRCLDRISLKDVAAAVHRTPAHVASSVKKSTGYSVGEWINSGRVGEAANRLVHTDDTLDEIANRVGWRDKTHLIRQFRKVYGATPAAWRKRHRPSHAAPRAAGLK